jgi:hypothetical protein
MKVAAAAAGKTILVNAPAFVNGKLAFCCHKLTMY